MLVRLFLVVALELASSQLALAKAPVTRFLCNRILSGGATCNPPRIANFTQRSEATYVVSNKDEFMMKVAEALIEGKGLFEVEFNPPVSQDTFLKWNDEFWGIQKTAYDIGYIDMFFPWALWNSMRYSYVPSLSGVSKVLYSVSYYCSPFEKREASLKASAIVRSIAGAYKEVFVRERAIHDWIAKNVTYDLESLGGYDQTDCKALFEGMAVCNGYSVLAARMLNMAGIRTLFVAGEAHGVPHAWNMVKLGDDWFHLDVTFDDPLCGTGTCGPLYDYFNLSDEEIAFDHDWDRSLYPSANKTFSETLYSDVVVHTCSIFEPELCRSELDCLRISGTWKDSVCYPPGEEEVTSCDFEHRFLCRDEASCEGAGGVWYNSTCVSEDAARFFCKTSGGTWGNGECLTGGSGGGGQEPMRVPERQDIGMYIGDTNSAPVSVRGNSAMVAFRYDGNVDILVGIISCDFRRIWWLGSDCRFHGEYDVAASRTGKLVCSDIDLPLSSGWVFWLASGTPLSQLDWVHGAYELKFYSFGRCK